MLRYALLDLTVWQFPFCPFSHLGGIPFCRLESRLLPFLFFCWVFWRLWLLLCFLFSFLVLFFRTILIFLWLCLCTLKDPRLLVVAEDPGYFNLVVGFFFLMLLLLGFKPLGPAISSFLWPPCTYFLGLGYCAFFRPQHLNPRACGLPETHAWVI